MASRVSLVFLAAGAVACGMGCRTPPSPTAATAVGNATAGTTTTPVGSPIVTAAWTCGTSPIVGAGVATGVVVDTELRPITGARLRNAVLNRGFGCETDAAGQFAFTYPLSASSIEVVAARYNSRTVGWARGAPESAMTIVMQETLTLARGERLRLSLTDADLPQYVGEVYESAYCSPCKEITLGGAASEARLQWTGGAPLEMWASDGVQVRQARADGDHAATVEIPGSTRIYVGLPIGQDRKPQHLGERTFFEVSVR